MSARKAGVNATRQRSGAAKWRDAALMTASREIQPSMTKPASRQPSACKPKQPAYGVRWLVATAALARTVRWPFPEVKACTPQLPAVRGSRASTDASNPLALSPNSGGLTMEKAAQEFFYDPQKFVPLGGFTQSDQENSDSDGKPLICRTYTLCEV